MKLARQSSTAPARHFEMDRAMHADLLEIVQKCQLHRTGRVLRINQVRQKIGLANSTIWAGVKAGSLPPPFPISSHSVGWLEAELDALIEARVLCARLGIPLEVKEFVRQLTSR